MLGIFNGASQAMVFGAIIQGDLVPARRLEPMRGAGGAMGSDNRAPELKSLIIETGGLSLDTLESVVTMQAPRLERPELWTGDDGYGARLREVAAAQTAHATRAVDEHLGR